MCLHPAGDIILDFESCYEYGHSGRLITWAQGGLHTLDRVLERHGGRAMVLSRGLRAQVETEIPIITMKRVFELKIRTFLDAVKNVRSGPARR